MTMIIDIIVNDNTDGDDDNDDDNDDCDDDDDDDDGVAPNRRQAITYTNDGPAQWRHDL